jgi:cytochrome c peroxidase
VVLFASGLAAWSAIAQPRRAKQIELGEALFHTTQLSQDQNVACATCHQPNRAFSDGLATPNHAGTQPAARNTPSLLAVNAYQRFAWDGRNTELSRQVLEPFFSAGEHGLTTEREFLLKIRNSAALYSRFRAAYGREAVTVSRVGDALAAYVRSIGVDTHAMRRASVAYTNDAARRGRDLFIGKAACAACHRPSTGFSDSLFHAGYQAKNGEIVKSDATYAAMNRARLRTHTLRYQRFTASTSLAELGAFVTTLQPADVGKFRTPSLVAVSRTAPYFHDGSEADLKRAVAHEAASRGGVALTAAEVDDLVAYLASL